MKILGIKTAYRLTKEKVVTTCCVTAVMGLCCVAAIAVNTLLNYSDVQALRVDPGDVIEYDVIPEEYAPDRENNGIKTPSITSDTKAGQKLTLLRPNPRRPSLRLLQRLKNRQRQARLQLRQKKQRQRQKQLQKRLKRLLQSPLQSRFPRSHPRPLSRRPFIQGQSLISEQVPARATRS